MPNLAYPLGIYQHYGYNIDSRVGIIWSS